MTQRDRWTLVLGAVVVVAAWLALRGVPQTLSHFTRVESELEQRADLLARARREVQDLAPLSDSIARLEAVATSLHRILLMGGDGTTASFDLTRRLSTILSRTTAFVDGIEPVADSMHAGALRRSQVRASLETDVVGLVSILGSIESDSTMAVEALDVVSPSPDDGTDRIERLRVQINVTGWFVPDTTKTSDEVREATS